MAMRVSAATNTIDVLLRKAWLALPLCAVLAGCDRGVGRQELGQVIFADPEVPGSRDPYPLPQLEAPKSPPKSSLDATSE